MPPQSTVLVVDDDQRNLRLINAMLAPCDYRVLLASDGRTALETMNEDSVDIVLLDVMMPDMSGYDVAKSMRASEKLKHIPIVMVTSLNEVDDRVRALELGADDFLTKPVDQTELRARVRSLMRVKTYNDYMQAEKANLQVEVERQTAQLQRALDRLRGSSLDTIYRLSKAAEYKDEDTGDHILRMSHYAAAVAKKLELGDNIMEAILYAAPMHDVGKIGVPDQILLKPGKLDADEWKIMKQHTIIGAQILANSDAPFIQLAEVIALTHHEKWDGGGYPRGLRGDLIPTVGQVTAIADVFDALTSKRPYKEAFSVEKAVDIIKEGSGSHFNPRIADAFLSIQPEILDIKAKFAAK